MSCGVQTTLGSGSILAQEPIVSNRWQNVELRGDLVTEDRAQGQKDQAKGEVKEGVGKLTGDRSTEASGKLDQAKGKVEDQVGQAKESIENRSDRGR
jgi:uncharacterized protein YjbJ (UPF0337 family)